MYFCSDYMARCSGIEKQQIDIFSFYPWHYNNVIIFKKFVIIEVHVFIRVY
jgi:hypothetical protein